MSKFTICLCNILVYFLFLYMINDNKRQNTKLNNSLLSVSWFLWILSSSAPIIKVHYVWSKMLIKLIGCMTRFGPNIPEVGQQWCQHSNWCLIMLIQYPVVVVPNIFMRPIKQISIWSLTSCIMMVSLSFADCCDGNIPNIGEESEKFVLLETPLVLNIVILPIKWISALWRILWVD